MITFPIDLKVAGRHVLVVGGGDIACKRAGFLVEAGAVVRVVSLECVPGLIQMRGVERVIAAYTPEMIHWAWLVFACTDDRQVNARIAADARAAGVLCNAADDPDECDFFMPAVLRRGSLVVAIGTGGASPALAACLRDELESQFEADFGILVEELERARNRVRHQQHDFASRRSILMTLAGQESVELFRRDRQAWKTWFERKLAEASEAEQTSEQV